MFACSPVLSLTVHPVTDESARPPDHPTQLSPLSRLSVAAAADAQRTDQPRNYLSDVAGVDLLSRIAVHDQLRPIHRVISTGKATKILEREYSYVEHDEKRIGTGVPRGPWPLTCPTGEASAADVGSLAPPSFSAPTSPPPGPASASAVSQLRSQFCPNCTCPSCSAAITAANELLGAFATARR